MAISKLTRVADLVALTLALMAQEQAYVQVLTTQGTAKGEVPAALALATDRLDQILEQLLQTGDDDALIDALEALAESGNHEGCFFLDAAIEAAAGCTRDEQGHRYELTLVPVLVAEGFGHVPLTPQQCHDLATTFKDSALGRDCARVTVERRLREPAEVYNLSYCQVYELNRSPLPSLGHLARCSLHESDPNQWAPVLRFLSVHLERAARDDEPGKPGQLDEGDPALKPTKEELTELVSQIACEVAVSHGTPLVCVAPGTVFKARRGGMTAYALKVAKLSLERQLAASGLHATSMVVTLHTEEDLGIESEICQARVSLIGDDNCVIAGHIIESNDWLVAQDVIGVLHSVCGWAGLKDFKQAGAVIAMPDDEGPHCLFCNGDTWAPLPKASHRLAQSL